MNSRLLLVIALSLLSVQTGCFGPKQPEFDALHPVTGKLQRAGAPLARGAVSFKPIPENQEFNVNGEVGDDGSFKLTTVRMTDSKGERRPGAPAGEYNVIYIPESKDQTVAFQPPITLPQKVVIEAKDNSLTLEVPAR